MNLKNLPPALVAAIFCRAAASTSLAQGTINFSSSTSPTFCIITNTVTGVSAKITPTNYLFGIYFGTTTNALLASMTPVLTVRGSGFPGYVSDNSNLPIPGLPVGGAYLFEVKGWTAAGGATYEAALTSSVGGVLGAVSAIGEVKLGGGFDLPGMIFGSSGGAVAAPVFIILPEPSSWLLGGLGITVIALCRRRK